MFKVNKKKHQNDINDVILMQPSKLGLRSRGKILPQQFAFAAANYCGTFLLFNKFE